MTVEAPVPIARLTGRCAASDPAAPSAGSSLGTFLHLLAVLWPLWVIVGLVGGARLVIDLYRPRRLAKSGIREVDLMDGKTFEEFLGTLFRRLGYRVENTRYRGDYGADLVVSKDGFKTAVQAKRWNKRIGVKAVQEAVASAGYYKCHRTLVVANRDFTRQAQVLARATSSTASDNGDSTNARCVTCGVAVSEKVRDYCPARPQRFGGRVYCFKHQRGVHKAVTSSE